MNTPWLQLLIGGLIALLSSSLGWWVAVRAQERADVKRIRNAARALLQDVGRIREAIGAPTAAALDLSASEIAAGPRVHPWLHTLIPELASLSGEAVRRFLALDSHLTEREVRMSRYAAVAKYFDATVTRGDNYRTSIVADDPNRSVYENDLRSVEREIPHLQAQLVV